MVQAIRKLTFEEYANLDAETWADLGLPEGRCEYVDESELNELPSESELNDWIARYLFLLLANSGLIQPRLICPGKCEVEVRGKPKTRYPDLVILREDHLSLTQKRLFIRLAMPNPQLVVEVVSPGDETSDNYQRDYIDKPKQYADRGIPEYWRIDPSRAVVTVLWLVDGQYQETSFKGDDIVLSSAFPDLQLTANQILKAGN
jgi:Uma2 family endonuclease